MTRKINTYKDILVEKQRLTLLLDAQKDLLRQDMDEIRKEFEPLRSAISVVSKITTRDPGNWFINSVLNKVIDFVTKRIILSRAGWLTKLIVPFFLKNYSSHYMADHKDEIIDKLFAWVSRKNENGKEEHLSEDHDSPY
jgi:hypothetical protein